MAEPPAMTIDPEAIYRATITTDKGGVIVMDLDPSLAPNTVNNFVSLARDGYYDGLKFHRVVPEFVIQGGDPTASGSGGPGYSTVDEPPSDATYPKYTVAMAKAGNEPPGTAGSQFFVMTGDRGLPPEYAIVGKVTDGTEVIDRIGALGDAAEQPTQTVLIEKVTVQES